ncbi:RHS repeat-associated core domain protein [Leptospira interrogans str. 2002000623]|nr:RHS repeat-associated core domain protein [Leptospira interrogans str. 2002000624]EKQ35955.1 RHS repeat-associated core domain protein [Leptospira interrogans str. 2002000621]EKQ45802.1 RHS repeat-associated core domain protein [Leptospira interrogans str. 2002000623]EMJ71715.1 RHS repeat-associated core domain protein [Leptospira interrogans str. 2002000632]OOB97251.1 hypothetical protein B0192_17925 [Leptospira interrogans serovar Australis]
MQHAMNGIFLFTILFHVALQIVAKSPVSEKQERINNVEYNETLKYQTTFLQKPPFCPLNGGRIAALNEAGALAYYLTDQVDSVSTVLDDEGNTLSLMQYLPYGETFVQRGDLNFSPKFNSQELDRESGFYFYNARFYDPGIARFTSADTLIDGELDTQGWNRFSYVKGNPIGAKDPTGHLVAGDPKHPGKPLSANPYANDNPKEYYNNVSEKAGPKGTEKAAKEYLNGLKDGHDAGKSRTSFGILDVITGGTVKGQKSANEKDKFKNSQSEFYKEGYGKGKTRGAIEGATESALDWLPLFGMAKGGLKGISGGSKGGKSFTPKESNALEKTPKTNPELFKNVRGCKGKCSTETGEIWEKDLLHKNQPHYEVYKNKKNYESGARDRSVWEDGRFKEKF